MEELDKNERKGQGTFYMIVAMLTLVVAIVGATFAYFSLEASDENTVKGTAAKVGLSLEVRKVSVDASGDLVPLDETLLEKAIAGDVETSNKMCVDKNGNTVCQVYEVKVTNEGTAATAVNGSLTLSAKTITNLKWQIMTDQSTPVTDSGQFKTTSDTEIANNDTIEANPGTKTYYIMIWIDEIESPQNDSDTGAFTGVVSFTSADGSGVTGTFTEG